MDTLCRHLAVFVFICVVIFVYFYVTVSNDTTILYNKNTVHIIERNQSINYPKRNEHTSFEQQKYENYKESTLLSILRRGQTMQTDNANHFIRKARILNATVQNEPKKKHLKSKRSSFPYTKTDSMKVTGIGHIGNFKKEIINTANNNNNGFRHPSRFDNQETQTFNHFYQTKSECVFYFDEDSFLRAKKKLSEPQSFYLFYINVEGNPSTNFSNIERDDLLHWQYIVKDEKYIVQLPVDFDLISFYLLLVDREETVLSLTLLYNTSNCVENVHNAKRSIRILLWNELFENNTDFFLCNRHYKKEIGRFWMYAITTIWIGFDLTCSEVNSEIGIHEYPITKEDLPLIYPIFCYLMSLQFVWFFVMLDIQDTYQESSKDEVNQGPNNQNQGSNVSDEKEEEEKTNNHHISFSYKRHDRPYGLKRFFIKLLYCKPFSNSIENQSICCKIIKIINESKPSTRLILFLWITILAPFGLYRTLGRYYLGTHIYNDYLDAVLPSEPSFYLISPAPVVLFFDIIYAIFCPLFLLWLVREPYDTYKFHKLYICHFEKNENKKVRKTKLKDRFIYPCSLICKIICCKHCKKSRFCLWNFCLPVYFVMCLFPFIPFFCAGYNSYCSNCCRKIECFCCINWIKKGIKYICIFLAFILSYILCYRPIISTFTFLFRAFTYIFFVALPIRVDIMQFTLVLGSIIVYISNYICEIINMNEEILEHVFEMQREKNEEIQTNRATDPDIETKSPFSSKKKDIKNSNKPKKNESNNVGNKVIPDENTSSSSSSNLFHSKNIETKQVEVVSEDKFDYIYENLSFVNKRLYFLFVKVIVVVMYFIIIVQSFLFDRKSMNAPHFRDIFSIILVIIGPYAISFFLKGNKHTFLNNENKSEIKAAYDSYPHDLITSNQTTSRKTNSLTQKKNQQLILNLCLRKCLRKMKRKCWIFNRNDDQTPLLKEDHETDYGSTSY